MEMDKVSKTGPKGNVKNNSLNQSNREGIYNFYHQME